MLTVRELKSILDKIPDEGEINIRVVMSDEPPDIILPIEDVSHNILSGTATIICDISSEE